MDEFPAANKTPSPEAARRELDDAVADLVQRFRPATLAEHALEDAKLAASDAAAFVTGGGLPEDSSRRKRNAIALVATSGGLIALVAIKAIRRKRD